MYPSKILRLAVALAIAATPMAVLAQASKDSAKPAAQPTAQPGPVATVNGVAIPRARVEAVVKRQMARGQRDNDQLRTAIREDLINREIIMQEATRGGLAKRGDIQMQMELARQEVIVGAFIDEFVQKNPVTDAEIQKEYDTVKAQSGEREYKARHILVESEDEAKKVLADLKGGAKFEEIAQKVSKDSTKDRGGDLDWNVPDAFDKAFSDAMVKLEKGKTSEAPVRTRFGFHVIRVDDVRTLRFPPLAEVKPRIQQQLVQRKIDGMVRDLRAKAKVE